LQIARAANKADARHKHQKGEETNKKPYLHWVRSIDVVKTLVIGLKAELPK
jgi:hypothetical protein